MSGFPSSFTNVLDPLMTLKCFVYFLSPLGHVNTKNNSSRPTNVFEFSISRYSSTVMYYKGQYCLPTGYLELPESPESHLLS